MNVNTHQSATSGTELLLALADTQTKYDNDRIRQLPAWGYTIDSQDKYGDSWFSIMTHIIDKNNCKKCLFTGAMSLLKIGTEYTKEEMKSIETGERVKDIVLNTFDDIKADGILLVMIVQMEQEIVKKVQNWSWLSVIVVHYTDEDYHIHIQNCINISLKNSKDMPN